MKKDMKLAVALLVMLLPIMVKSQITPGSYTLKGKMYGIKPGSRVVMYLIRYQDNFKDDSVIVKNGSFSFSGKTKDPIWAEIFYKMEGSKKTPYRSRGYNLFLEKGTMVMNFKEGKIAAASIAGSSLNKEKQAFEKEMQPITKEMESAMSAYFRLEDKMRDSTSNKTHLVTELRAVEKKVDSLDVIKYSVEGQYIAKHKTSYFSLWLASESFRHGLAYEKVLPLFNQLNPKVANTGLGRKLKAQLKEAQMFAIGKQTPGFELPDSAGNLVSLSSYRGKYVLLDFWASWCFPCRQENPNVLNAYQKFKDNGFTVLGVSIDTNKQSWLKALKEDQLAWGNVADLKGDVNKLYNITAVPSNFLLDPEGRIVARNLRGDRLEKKLSELLNMKK